MREHGYVSMPPMEDPLQSALTMEETLMLIVWLLRNLYCAIPALCIKHQGTLGHLSLRTTDGPRGRVSPIVRSPLLFRGQGPEKGEDGFDGGYRE